MERAEDGTEPDAMDAAGEAAEVVGKDTEPTDAAGWIARGRDLYERERVEEALAAFDRAIELAPEDAEAWAWRGAALVDLAWRARSVRASGRRALSGGAYPWMPGDVLRW